MKKNLGESFDYGVLGHPGLDLNSAVKSTECNTRQCKYSVLCLEQVLNTSTPVIKCTSTTANLSMIPLQPMERTTVKQVVLAACGEDHTRADNRTAACAGPHAGVGGCFLKELWPAESPCWRRSS